MTTIGIPAEIKSDEGRVAITPDGVREAVAAGLTVLVEAGAGANAAITDDEYRQAGARLTADAAEAWGAPLVCKVKEPQVSEFAHFRPDLTLFAYLHLAAYRSVADELLAAGVTAMAYETVQTPTGLPLLAPMSEIAGRMSVQIGSHYLESTVGGRGVLLAGVPGVAPGRVMVVGAGNVGWNAARMALGLGAEVVVLDKNLERLRELDQIGSGRLVTLASNAGAVERAVTEADLLIGAVLVPGGKAPTVVTEEMIATMRPGSVLVDVAVDQGGCLGGTRETSHRDPVYEHHGSLHYAVGNMPGAVPRTSTWALTNATLPYIVRIGRAGWRAAAAADPAIALGVNIAGGQVVNAAVAEALGRPHHPLPLS